jgi:hypothetical protein
VNAVQAAGEAVKVGGRPPGVLGVADEGGRGLPLVAALSDKWGAGERSPGKSGVVRVRGWSFPRM